MKKAILITVSHLLLVFAQAFAQIPELTHSSVIPPSPVASELTKYITYPVDLCNGLVKTSIPLYEIVDGDTGAVIETSDYYPFGKRIQISTDPEPVEGAQHTVEPTAISASSATSPNRWHFSGKESQSFLNASIPLLDFGARLYDSTIARWTTADPMAEKYYGISQYAYCLGNPISIIDPNGKDIWTMDEYGNVGRSPLRQFGAYFKKNCIYFMHILEIIALISCGNAIFAILQVMQWNNFTNISQES